MTELDKDDDENIIGCKLQAVINKNIYPMQWQDLKDQDAWLMGWK